MKNLGTMAGAARLLRAVFDEPRTAVALQEDVACRSNLRNVVRTLESLAALRLIHAPRWEWVQAGYRRTWHAVWVWGPGENAPAPAGKRPHEPKRLTIAVIDLAAVLRALDAPLSSLEISAETGLSRVAVQRLMLVLHGELRLLRVAGWERTERAGPWRYYELKPDGRDVPKPKPRDKAEKHKVDWQRRKTREQQLRMLRAIACNNGIFTMRA